MAIIQSGASTDLLTVESTSKAARVTIRPNESVGSYTFTAVSGSIAGGTAAGVLYTFRNGGSNLIALRRISVGLQTTTAYTKGSLRLSTYFVRTSFTQGTTNATLVTLTGNNAKKRTNMTTTSAVAYICTTTVITGDTATGEDTQPFGTTNMDLLAVVGNTPTFGLADVYRQDYIDYPVILAAGEGFRLKNDTAFAATGASNLIVNVSYEELSSF